TRFWYGPALGAVIVTALTQSLTGGESAVLNRALIGAILIAVIVFLPDGVAGGLSRARRARAGAAARPASETVSASAAPPARAGGDGAGARLHQRHEGVPWAAGAHRGHARGPRRRDSRPHRSERLGQVDPDQRRQRLLPGRRRPGRAGRPRHRARAGPPHRGA